MVNVFDDLRTCATFSGVVVYGQEEKMQVQASQRIFSESIEAVYVSPL